MVYCIIVLVVLVIEENNICFLNFEQLFHKKKHRINMHMNIRKLRNIFILFLFGCAITQKYTLKNLILILSSLYETICTLVRYKSEECRKTRKILQFPCSNYE